MMKALSVQTPTELSYVLIDQPVCEEGKTLLKVERIGICGTDLHAYEGTQPYFTYPRILGHELALTVAETTAQDFVIGEAVTIIPYFNCGKCISCRMGKPNCCVNMKVFGVHIDGGMCEYVLIPNEYLVHGDGLGLDELALVEPLAIGAHGVRRAAIEPGEFVLVIGAGPIGLGTIEFAKIAGAQVIVLDINEHRLNFCREKLGITSIINGLTEDALLKIKEITNGDMPTVVIDATGNLNAINKGFDYLAHGGRYVLIGLQKETISVVHPEFHKREATLMSSRNASKMDFEHVISSMKKGLINPTNYITHSVHFDEVIDQFDSWLDPENHVIKAMVRF
jgi:2-desacetyl-2-hydroxyethyl bacteriochlorophyllide A dehydrogenase